MAGITTSVQKTGTGKPVHETSPTLVQPALGTPTSGTLTNCTGLPVAGGGTGVATFTANTLYKGNTTSALAATTIIEDASRNVLTGGLAAAGTSAAKVLGMASGTAPTTSPADAAQMWVQDNTGQGASGLAQYYMRDEYGISGPVAFALEQRETQNVIEDLSYLPTITFTWDPGSLDDGVGETSSAVTVPGATLGDTMVFCVAPYDLQGITLTAWVDAANSCKARLQNETGGTINLASGTWSMKGRRI